MTDAAVSQQAIVAIQMPVPDTAASQMAMVAVCSEVPPVSGGARIFEYALVTVSKEFVIPKVLVPLGCGAFMATMPYYIGKS